MIAVVDWMKIYESAASRRLGKMSWVRIPTSHDGGGYRRLMASADGTLIYGAFLQIVTVATKMHERGIFAGVDGSPLDAVDIASISRGSADVIERAVKILASKPIRWLAEVETIAEARLVSGRDAENGVCYAENGVCYAPQTSEESRGEERREEASERAKREEPARPPAHGTGAYRTPTANTDADSVSERGGLPDLVDAVWLAMREFYPRVDRAMAERVAICGVEEATAKDWPMSELLAHAATLIRSAKRKHQRGAAMFLETFPEEIQAVDLVEVR